jgi:hypothetical protein
MIGFNKPLSSVPWGFQDEFVRAGWRGVERAYAASTELLLRWIELSGREQLYRKRAEYVAAMAAANRQATASSSIGLASPKSA